MQEENYDSKNYNMSQNINYKEQTNSYYPRHQRRVEQVFYQKPYSNEEDDEYSVLGDQAIRVSKTKFKGDRQELQQEKKTEVCTLEKFLEPLFEQEKVLRNLEMEIKSAQFHKEMLMNSLEKSEIL